MIEVVYVIRHAVCSNRHSTTARKPQSHRAHFPSRPACTKAHM